jgi:two-component system response regulator TctD
VPRLAQQRAQQCRLAWRELQRLVQVVDGAARGIHPQPAPARRLNGAAEPPSWCGLRVDAASGAVYHLDKPLELAPREAALLRALLAKPGHAVAKERLFEAVFAGDTSVQLEAIEVVAYRLRKKLAPTGVQLVTLRGLGYLLQAPA